MIITSGTIQHWKQVKDLIALMDAEKIAKPATVKNSNYAIKAEYETAYNSEKK